MLRNLQKSEFTRNVVTLTSGTAIAQAITIVLTPVISRLYTPEDFGALAVFLSIYSIITIIATSRFELIIIIPVKDDEAINIAALSVLSSLIVGFLSLIFFIFFETLIKNYFDYGEQGVSLYLISFCVLLYGTYQNLYYWFNRKMEFKQTSINSITQSLSSLASKIAFGLIKIFQGGLIIGTIIGQFLSTVLFLHTIIKKYKNELATISFSRIIIQLKRYYKLATTLTVSHGLQGVYTQIPVLFIAKYFDMMTIGFVSLATKVVTLPISTISAAFGDVFRQKASEEYHRSGTFDKIFISTVKKTFLISIIPFSLIFFFAPPLFSFVFGKEWEMAGEYLQIIIIGELFAFIINPIDKASLIREKKKYILAWNMSRFLSNVVIVLITLQFNLSVKYYLLLLSGINVTHYLIDLSVCYRFSKGK